MLGHTHTKKKGKTIKNTVCLWKKLFPIPIRRQLNRALRHLQEAAFEDGVKGSALPSYKCHPFPTGSHRISPENRGRGRPVPSKPGSRPVGVWARMEAHSSDTAEQTTKEKQDQAQDQQSGATQS